MFVLESKPFFRRSDWIAFGLTFLIALVVYTLTLAPTVTLEDSGELVVASDYLGVPHPPGYPIWSLLTWAFQWVFHGVTYHGYPNPAWAVNFFSGFAGALACGILAMLVSRSGMELLRSLKKETDVLGEKTESLFCATAGMAAGLLLAFSQGMWSQAVIAEVYTLNILFQTAVLLFLYRWMAEPDRPKPLFLMAFTFGLGLTNHQTLLFMGLAIGLAVFLRNIRLARDFAAVGVFYVLMVFLNKFGPVEWQWTRGPGHFAFWFWSVYAVVVPVLGLFLPNGKTVCATYLLMLLGLSFYVYMPFASEQNPPINWGYPRTWEGFMHAITRGQYERVTLTDVFSLRFLQQIGAYLHDLRSQFFGPVALLAVLPFAFIVRVGRRNRNWLFTTLLAFVGVGIIFIILQNPKLDMQTLFIARVQYIQSHAIYAIWLGYGLLLLMAWLEALVGNNPFTKWLGTLMVFLLPFSLVAKNYFSEEQKRVVGGSEQNGHDFGWQFGNWQLRGVEGIKEDLWYYCDQDEEKFAEEWADYPNPEYPPPMGTNAIFFGGTDPGRFVPTYMIYCPQVRPDVYLITQNALADNTYMAVMRDLYGDQIWIPSQLDSNRAFNEYVEGIRSGKIQAGADVQMEGGRVQVQGVGGVMQINGILCKQIFDHNQFITEVKTDEATRQSGAAVVPRKPVLPDGSLRRRDFFVEESYVIPWMYPYLTPHGLIMKINNEKTDVTEAMIKNDREFWDWYVERLTGDEKFLRDVVARKTFSKLRSAIAGLYSARADQAAREHASARAGAEDFKRMAQRSSAQEKKAKAEAAAALKKAKTSRAEADDAYKQAENKAAEAESADAKAKEYMDSSASALLQAKQIEAEIVAVQTNAVASMTTTNEAFSYEVLIEEKTKQAQQLNSQAETAAEAADEEKRRAETARARKKALESKARDALKKETSFRSQAEAARIQATEYAADAKQAQKRKREKDNQAASAFKMSEAYAAEAEYAFKQAVELYPLSPEATFRLADLYMREKRFEDALEVVETFIEKDARNESAAGFLKKIRQAVSLRERRGELEEKLRGNRGGDIRAAFELIQIYNALQENRLMHQLINDVLQLDLSANVTRQLTQMLLQIKRFDAVEPVVVRHLKKHPNDFRVRIDWAAVLLMQGQTGRALGELEQAVKTGGEAARAILRKDTRLRPLWGNARFKALVPSSAGRALPAGGPSGLRGLSL